MSIYELLSLVVAVSAVAAAFIASYYARSAAALAKRQTSIAERQRAIAEDQTAIQRQVREDAAQPYVWVDIRPDDEAGGLFILYLGNSGPTVATDVRVTFDPPLPETSAGPQGIGRTAQAVTQLRRGVSSLPPGRRMQWSLGVAHERINDLMSPTGYVVTIHAKGPFGEVAPLQYAITLQDVRFNLKTPPGTLNGVTIAVQKLTEAVKGLGPA